MHCCAIFKRICAAALAAALLLVTAAAAPEAVRGYIDGIYGYKKGTSAFALDNLTPGEANSDWMAMAVAKSGISDNYSGYLERLSAYVADSYASVGGLDRNKATEWHRIAMTVRALGGDPTDFGGVDLLRDGVTEPVIRLERQGINGLVWAAIAAADCGAVFGGELTLEKICTDIAARQHEDGSFSLSGGGDPDVTAMAIRALAGVPGFEENAARARTALEAMRLPGGGFVSGGAENSESTAQVIMALCALGERPDFDVEVLLRYRNADGGFSHLPGGKSDDMASAQAMLALLAYWKMPVAEAAPAEELLAEKTSSEQISIEQAPSEQASPEQTSSEQTLSDEAEDKSQEDPAEESEENDLSAGIAAAEQIPVKEEAPQERTTSSLWWILIPAVAAAALILVLIRKKNK